MTISWRHWLGMDTTVRLPAREGYAVWAETYPPRPHNRLMAAEQEIVEPIIRSTGPRRALDVGTGTGRYLALLHTAGARLVVGVDMSLPLLQQRRRKKKRPRRRRSPRCIHTNLRRPTARRSPPPKRKRPPSNFPDRSLASEEAHP